MRKLLSSIVLLSVLSISASACEGWKSEYFKLALKTSAYAVTYSKYAKGKFTEEKFTQKKEHLLSDIQELQTYVNSTESCSGKESRKTRLQSWISKVIEAIKNNSDKASALAKEIKNDFY